MQPANSILCLDVGEKRIGVALASLEARLPQPLITLSNTKTVAEEIAALVREHHVERIVVGLPMNRHDEPTDQTRYTQAFADTLRAVVAVPIDWQDEALSSQRAAAELRQTKKRYQKSDIDAYAAMFILEDYLASQPRKL